MTAARRVASDGSITPEDCARIVGASFVKHERQPILTIGKRSWDRLALGAARCPHPKAAANLNRIVQQLGITSLQELAARAPEIGMYKTLGVTAYYTILALLAAEGFPVSTVHGEEIRSFAALKHDATKLERVITTRRRRQPRRRGI